MEENKAPASAAEISIRDCTHAFAVPGRPWLADLVHPRTGKSLHRGLTLEEMRAEYPGAELVEVEAWQKRRAAEQDAPVEWIPTTEQQWWKMLEVLPPIALSGGCFLVGEPVDHHALSGLPRYDGYVRVGSDPYHLYFRSSRPMTVEEFRARDLSKVLR